MATYGPFQPAGSFELDIARFVHKAKGNANQVVRRVALDLFKRVIIKSPVGNPDTWESNKDVMTARQATIDEAAVKGKRVSKRTLAKKHPLNEGQGYVGGRFKSNWQVAIGSIPTGVIDLNDQGASALARVNETALSMVAGQVISIINNLSYSRRLEYGHSKQAPNGMVRITVTEYPQVVRKAASEVK